jgi:hypothetical protein
MNSHKNWYSRAENPRLIYSQTSCHDKKVGIWCAVNAHRITGPVFYDDAVNAAKYINVLYPFFFYLTEVERLHRLLLMPWQAVLRWLHA